VRNLRAARACNLIESTSMTFAFHKPTQYRPAPKAPAARLRAGECLAMPDRLLRETRNAGFTRID
jgi:hypothetical protein